ncbi:MAG: CRTAC1 family protein [Solirubrobacterales bacterium]|nr:CRTAC1 family protein [Solirubrobacterales bacterium]
MSAGSGLTKGGCRARQSAAVDVDGDGQLDLFETCEGEAPRIFRQQSRGRFTNLPSPDSVGTTYRWAELGGPRPSLLAAEPRGTKVWSYTSTGWKLQQSVHDNARKGQVAQYALNDYDNDGDLDVLAVSRSGNTLLNNSRGLLEKVPLKGTGIPLRSVAASFVDYDNDGRIDLDLIPQGLLHGLGDTRFKSVRRLRTAPSGAGITNWFDYDNDGLRDPVIVTGNAEFAQEMTVTRSRNLGPGGHWLEVNLHGQGGNREAIGARVAIRSGNHHLYGWVGQSDDSHHSQGHYRLYFGLGGHAQVGEMIVKWPNGNSTRFGAFPADQVVDINQP